MHRVRESSRFQCGMRQPWDSDELQNTAPIEIYVFELDRRSASKAACYRLKQGYSSPSTSNCSGI
jgi:hypothetical protein